MNRTDRLYALVEELRAAAPGYRSTTWLAERFEVSGRTIERDLSALQQAGVPIYATPGRRGGYAIDVEHTLPPLNLTAGEVVAVATALATDMGTPFSQAGRSALQKLLTALREVDAEGARDLADRVRLFDRDERPRPPGVVEHAILQRRVVELDYVDRAGVPTKRVVEPLGVLRVQGAWYLLAWCRLLDDDRVFKLERILGAVMLDERCPDRDLPPLPDGPDAPTGGRGIF